MKRFFSKLQLGTQDIVLDQAEYHHLADVLRLKSGDIVTGICGDEYDYMYRIAKITKTAASLEFVSKTLNNHNPKKSLTVYIALIKPDLLSLVVQKLNEIGAGSIVVFCSANCNLPPKSVNFEKLRTVAQQSCKQCGRSMPVQVQGVIDFAQMTKSLSKHAIFADERLGMGTKDGKKLSDIDFTSINTAELIIGPEGGFTQTERAELMTAAHPVSLGNRILRAETAAIAGVAIILGKMGEI